MRIAILLLGAAALWGQPAKEEAPKVANMEGTAISTDGSPVARAKVRLQGAASVQKGTLTRGERFETTADDAGKFSLNNIVPGSSYTLTAEKTGFVTARYGARTANGPAVTLEVKAGQELKGLTLRLSPQGVIRGRILDPNGDPLQGAQVVAQRRGYISGIRQLVPGESATTDDRGEFRIANVPAGRYTVTANVPRASQAISEDKTAPLLTYFPNTTDVKGAGFFMLAEGQDLSGIQIQMRRGVVYGVTGKAVDAAGAPLKSALAMAVPTNASVAEINGTAIVGTTGAEGAFALRGLVPGDYTLVVTNITAGTRGVGEFTISDHDAADVRVQVGGGFPVKGTIRLEGGELKDLLPPPSSTADRATQTALAQAAAVAPGLLGLPAGGGVPSVALTEAGGSLALRSAAGLLDQDGVFTLENLSRATYQYTVATLPEGTYLKSVRYGGSDVTGGMIQVTNAGGAIDIVLAKNAASVTGSVMNGENEPQAGLTVALWPQKAELNSKTGGVKTATTDGKGAFRFQGLAPGTYYAVAFEDVENGLAQARDFLTQLASDTAELELKEGDAPSRQLKMVPVEKIRTAEENLP